MVASRDQDAAQEQVRTALSLAARAQLLAAGISPGARDELPQQLGELGLYYVGEALASTIHVDVIPPGELELAVELCETLVGAPSDGVSPRQERRTTSSWTMRRRSGTCGSP